MANYMNDPHHLSRIVKVQSSNSHLVHDKSIKSQVRNNRQLVYIF